MDARFVEATNPLITVYTEGVGSKTDAECSTHSWDRYALGIEAGMSQL